MTDKTIDCIFLLFRVFELFKIPGKAESLAMWVSACMGRLKLCSILVLKGTVVNNVFFSLIELDVLHLRD